MAWKKTARQVEKKVFGTGGFKRRYGIGKGKGGFKLATLAKDLEMVKSRLNAEKKETLQAEITAGSVGQVFGSSNGYWFQDITPNIAQGTAVNERVGNSLKMTGVNLNFQFLGQQNALTGRKIKIGVYKVRDPSLGPTDASVDIVPDYFDTNPLTNLFDYNAAKAYRSGKNDGITCVREKTVYLPKVEILNQGGPDTANQDIEKAYKTLNMPIKLNDLFRYEANNDILPNGFRYVLVVRMDAGNSGVTTSTFGNIPITTNLSGATFRMGQRWWYVDN